MTPWSQKILTALSVLCSMLAATGMSMAQTPSAASLGRIGLEQSWRSQSVLNPRRDRLRHFSNDEEVIYAQSSAGVVSVFSAETGRRLWARQIGETDEFSMRAVSNDDAVLIVTGPVAWGLNKFTGEVLFEHRLPNQPSAAPAISERACYVPLSDGSVHSFSLETLMYQERYGELPPGAARIYQWRFRINEQIRLRPELTATGVMFSTRVRNLYSLAPTGATNYQQFLQADVTAPVATYQEGDQDAIVAATADGNLYGFDLRRGRLDWNVPLERNIYQQPMIHNGVVYFVMESSGMGAVSTQRGRFLDIPDRRGGLQRWFVPGIERLLGVGIDTVYAMDANRQIVSIDPESAAITGRVPLNQFSIAIQNTDTDRLYLASETGSILCLKPAGTQFATYHRRPENEPLEVVPGAAGGDEEDASAEAPAEDDLEPPRPE